MARRNTPQPTVRKPGRTRQRVPAAARAAMVCEPAPLMQQAAGALAASPVTFRIPSDLREKLHTALLQRADTGQSLAQIAQKLDLERYGVSLEMLAAHAEALDELIRPVVSAQIVAGVLGCLPRSVRARLLEGTQVLLLSRVFTALSESDRAGIPAGELMKFASVVRAAAQARRRRETGRQRRCGGEESGEEAALFDQDRLARAVRTLYGLSWPLEGKEGINSAPAPHP